jgi:hypothetical protein
LLSINYLYHRKEECANSPSPLKREVPLALNLWKNNNQNLNSSP